MRNFFLVLLFFLPLLRPSPPLEACDPNPSDALAVDFVFDDRIDENDDEPRKPHHQSDYQQPSELKQFGLRGSLIPGPVG